MYCICKWHLCMSTCVCRCINTSVCLHMGATGGCQVSPSITLHLTEPAAHWLASWLATPRFTDISAFPFLPSCPPESGYRHVPPCLAFMWVQGIQTAVLMLVCQAYYWLNHLSKPTITVFPTSTTQCGRWIVYLGRAYVLVRLIRWRLVGNRVTLVE